MPTEIEMLLGPEVYKKAKALIEAAGPDYDWGPLKRAVDGMMEKAVALQGIDFDKLHRDADEAVQLLKLRSQEDREDERYPPAAP